MQYYRMAVALLTIAGVAARAQERLPTIPLSQPVRRTTRLSKGYRFRDTDPVLGIRLQTLAMALVAHQTKKVFEQYQT
jgi:hypothetical protein